MMISMGRITALLIVIVLTASGITIFLPFQAGSRTIVVPDDYPTIAGAIRNVADGDTIFVRKGTYYNQSFQINRSLSLLSEDGKTTVLRGYFPTYMLIGPGFPTNSTVIQVNANDIKSLASPLQMPFWHQRKAILITTPSDEENFTPQQHVFLGTGLPSEIGYAILAVIATASVATFLIYFKNQEKHQILFKLPQKLKLCCDN